MQFDYEVFIWPTSIFQTVLYANMNLIQIHYIRFHKIFDSK